MELKDALAKSLAEPPILVPRHVLKSLEVKMTAYALSVGGQGPSPIPTRDDPDAKPIRQWWREARKKWDQIAKDLKAKDGVSLVRLKGFLESDELKQFEAHWHGYKHPNPKTIDPSGDELKQVGDFETEEIARRKNATDIEQAKKDVRALKDRTREDFDALREGAPEHQKQAIVALIKKIKLTMPEGKEDWIAGRTLWQELADIVDVLRDERTFGAQREENRQSFGEQLDKLTRAIDHLAPGKGIDKPTLDETKRLMREDLAKLEKVHTSNKMTSTWEPSADDLKAVKALWGKVYDCRKDTGDATPPEPGITVVHSTEITADANRWRAWEDKVREIDAAFRDGLLSFSSTMRLTGNPGCRFHQQGKHWKFYLDEAEMGGSTTIRGWYFPVKLDGGGHTVTFEAITNSHGGAGERVLYGKLS